MITFIRNKQTMQPVENAQVIYTDEAKNPYYIFQTEISAKDGSFNFDPNKSKHLLIKHSDYFDLHITLQPNENGSSIILIQPTGFVNYKIPEKKEENDTVKTGFKIKNLVIPFIAVLVYLISKQK